MASLVFQNNLGQGQGQDLKVSDPLGSPEKTLRNNHPWILDYEKLNLPVYRIFGDPLTRHHTHGRRVRHINGLLDLPICAVFDYDPPIAPNRAAETMRVDGDGLTEGKASADPMANPAKQNGHNGSSGNLRRLKDALSNSSHMKRKISEMKRQSHQTDIQKLPAVSPWREKLRTLVASLGLPDPHTEDDDSRREPTRNQTHDRPNTTSIIQALGTVGRTPAPRPMTIGSGTEKLPPLRGLYPRSLDGCNRPWFLHGNSRLGTSTIRTPGGGRTGKGQAPVAQGHAGSTTRPVHYSEATGRLIPPPSSRGLSSGASWKRDEVRLGGCKTDEEWMEGLVFAILCQLFEVDDLNSVRVWLINASDAERAIVLDLVRTALTGRSASDDKPRRNNVTSGLKEHPRTSGGQHGTNAEANDVLWSKMATDDDGWTNQKTGRVDRLVFDHSRPKIRTNVITCSSSNSGIKDSGQERSCKRTNEGQATSRIDHVLPAASNEAYHVNN